MRLDAEIMHQKQERPTPSQSEPSRVQEIHQACSQWHHCPGDAGFLLSSGDRVAVELVVALYGLGSATGGEHKGSFGRSPVVK